MINITNSSFLGSFVKLADCADYGLSEVAFLGRSNVGKSSLINALCNHKGLAKSSSTPGKTQLINFFKVHFKEQSKEEIKDPKSQISQSAEAIFVDLPGFGYAKVSKSLKDAWQKNLSAFLEGRVHIRAFLHLIDSRHAELESDLVLGDFLAQFLRPDQKILRIYTKADKLNQSQKAKIKAIDKNAILVSSAKNTGIKELREQIYLTLFS